MVVQKFLSLLLVAMALLSLSACGNKPDTESEQFPPTVYDGTGGTGGTGGTNGTGANGSPAPENNPEGRTLTPSQQRWDSGDDSQSEIPVTPYEDMVENGRVRDTDGILSDGENPQN